MKAENRGNNTSLCPSEELIFNYVNIVNEIIFSLKFGPSQGCLMTKRLSGSEFRPGHNGD